MTESAASILLHASCVALGDDAILILGASGSTPAATAASSSPSLVAYGRARSAASCARRSFAAATIFIALVICWVERTVPIRFLRALRLGTPTV